MSKPHAKETVTMQELLFHNDEQFIRYAYHALLGRDPDIDGFNYYHSRLKQGVSKVEILSQIHRSREGKARDIVVEGLGKSVRLTRLLKQPLLGSLLRLAGVKPPAVDTPKEESPQITLEDIDPLDFLALHDIDYNEFPSLLDVEQINAINTCRHFTDRKHLIESLLNSTVSSPVKLSADNRINALFYLKLSYHYARARIASRSMDLLIISLLFHETCDAYEHLANHALDDNSYVLAAQYYEMAVRLGSTSEWVYHNLAQCQSLLSRHDAAVRTAVTVIGDMKFSAFRAQQLDNLAHSYWNAVDQKTEFFASAQRRAEMIEEYTEAANVIAESYRSIFTRHSKKPLNCSLNRKRVLIVGLDSTTLPQCYRYRIEQKIEQLKCAGYTPSFAVWNDSIGIKNGINFNDIIIFYRCPSFPQHLKLAEYAKSLGKVTFYELDDLLTETFSIPPLHTYGGMLTPRAYVMLVKDIAYHRAMLARCHFALASTAPLVDRLAPLTLHKKCYLHRNGLDKYNRFTPPTHSGNDTFSLFYGSGTLAHNSDFIQEALPAITRIMSEFSQVRLITVGSLSLPDDFRALAGDRLVSVPLIRDIESYLALLATADLNLAPLHVDELTNCKSEIKWIEAATCSIPSVVSSTKNYLDVIRNGVDGFIASGPDQWYSQIRKLIVNKELRHKAGRSACSRVKQEYSLITLSKNIDAILCDALERFDTGDSQVVAVKKRPATPPTSGRKRKK